MGALSSLDAADSRTACDCKCGSTPRRVNTQPLASAKKDGSDSATRRVSKAALPSYVGRVPVGERTAFG
jgi:hypothetical protein